MLTVDYRRLGLRPGDRLLDLGCGAGRHAFEAYRRGAKVVALDTDADELRGVAELLAAMAAEGEASGPAVAVRGDALSLPFPDGAFDRIIAAEVLEHLPDDEGALAELVRVLRPGGTIAVSVPSALAERVCWALSEDYHAPRVPGGHLRIYRDGELCRLMRAAGLTVTGAHRAHALHTPYWWLRCAVGPRDDHHPLVRAYHRLLTWDIVHRPLPLRVADAALNPVLGKSVVVYGRRPGGTRRPAATAPGVEVGR